jgi:hypothetical protein
MQVESIVVTLELGWKKPSALHTIVEPPPADTHDFKAKSLLAMACKDQEATA